MAQLGVDQPFVHGGFRFLSFGPDPLIHGFGFEELRWLFAILSCLGR